MEINIKSNKFDNDIIQAQSYKIIKDDSLQRNNNKQNYNAINKIDSDYINNDNDEDKNINLNININNYLSKKNININSNQPINNIHYSIKNPQRQHNIRKYNTERTKGYLIQRNIQNKNNDSNNNSNHYSNIEKNHKYNNIKATKEELKSKLLYRINKQKMNLNNFDYNKINIQTKKGKGNVIYPVNKINEKINAKEPVKKVPKILTFLNTFKKFALPLKINDKNKLKENKIIYNNTTNNNNKNKNINANNTSSYFNKKIKLNQEFFQNGRNDDNDFGNNNNEDDFIDYNRFTFRNFGKLRKREQDLVNYNENENENDTDSFDNDINKNINIDAYNKKHNNIRKNQKQNNFNDKSNKYIQINIISKSNKSKNSPYLRKNVLKEYYTSPRPLPKAEIKKNNIYKKSKRINPHQNFDSNQRCDDSFRSLNISKIYRKQILNNYFQINSNTTNPNLSNYNNELSFDNNNYYTTNRQFKKNKNNEILIDINDSFESYNINKNLKPRINLRIDRSPINRKENNNNNLLMKRSPFASKQMINNKYENSDLYEDENDENIIINNIKPKTNYSRFMQPFNKRPIKQLYNEESFLSYNPEKSNANLLYKKPIDNNNSFRNINKNNSMYVKQIVPYESKKNSMFNESNDSLFNEKKNKNEFSELEIENNVYNFDAPKSINDYFDDKYSSNSSFHMIDSNQGRNTEFQSDRYKKKKIGKNQEQNLSFRQEEKSNIIYTKKLNTMQNFYKGTKKLLSNINNKIFKIGKKEDKKETNNNNKEIINKQKNINIKKNNMLIYQGQITPRLNDNESDNSSFFSFSTPTGYDNEERFIKNNLYFKMKIINKTNCFYKKYYNYYKKMPKINKSSFYFTNKRIYKIKKKKKLIHIPESFIRYFKKGKKAINKLPKVSKCYFSKNYIVSNNKKEKNLKINSLNINRQINLFYSKDTNQLVSIEKKEIIESNNFSFNNKKIIEDKIIKPEKIYNVSFIINKNIPNNNKYLYEYIISLKSDKLCLKDDSLPKYILDHFEELKEPTEVINYKLISENENENKNKIIISNKIGIKNDTTNNNNDLWKRSDFTKETKEAEKYVKELNEKMEENTKKNNIIGMLNILTVDNLNDVLNKIMILITRNEDNFILSDEEIIKNEEILVKAILNKAIMEIRFVNLYAKLCKELFHKLINVSYNSINFKILLINECRNKFNELNIMENLFKDKMINLNDEKLLLMKKEFIGNVDFISELIETNFFIEDIGFYYLEELDKIYNKEGGLEPLIKFQRNTALEATVNFLSKFGKKIFSDKKIDNINNLNNFININLKNILNNQELSGFLKYKIINLIEKKNNNWQDSLFEKSISAKCKNNKSRNSLNTKGHKSRKRRHSNKSLKIGSKNNINNSQKINDNSINTSINYSTINSLNSLNHKLNMSNSNADDEILKLIEKDIKKYINFFNENNILNKSDLKKKIKIGNEYDWPIIEDILSTNKINLFEIIRCYVEVCIDEIIDINIIFIANDYIKNIIYYYSSELSNRERDIIHNKIINLFLNITDICIDNNNMNEIMGFLLFILIENKLFFIKDLNKFIGLENDIIIKIAEVIKFAIVSSEERYKKYLNDFKQTKLFVDNPIFTEYVTNKINNI